MFFEDFEVGGESETGARTVTEADIVGFAGVSGDFNPLHIDQSFAEKTPFGRRIAHGMLGFAISTGLPHRSPPVALVAFLGIRDWKFTAPIFIGDTIRAKNKVVEKKETSKKDRGIIRIHRQILNQKNEVVQEGDTLALLWRRSP